jgi:ribosomal protein S18 acetylase RimI-like enzyme
MMNIRLRPFTDDDLEFLFDVYASTRTEELSVVPWDETQKQEFLRMQFRAQHVHYQEHYADASFDVIELDGVRAGRLYVQRRDGEHRIVDIALLPEHRGGGVGSTLLAGLLEEADAAGRRVSIHVEHQNPARSLYERLGFTIIDDTGVYHLMERQPPDRPTGGDS